MLMLRSFCSVADKAYAKYQITTVTNILDWANELVDQLKLDCDEVDFKNDPEAKKTKRIVFKKLRKARRLINKEGKLLIT